METKIRRTTGLAESQLGTDVLKKFSTWTLRDVFHFHFAGRIPVRHIEGHSVHPTPPVSVEWGAVCREPYYCGGGGAGQKEWRNPLLVSQEAKVSVVAWSLWPAKSERGLFVVSKSKSSSRITLSRCRLVQNFAWILFKTKTEKAQIYQKYTYGKCLSKCQSKDYTPFTNYLWIKKQISGVR